jgi:hypothetical protein
MSSLVNRFKSGAGKAAFEADKLRRIQSAQSALKPLRNEADRLYFEMGKLAYLLYTQGAISQPELRTAGERLVEAQAQIAAAEAEVERIRAEEYVEPIYSPSSRSGLICPNGHGTLAGGASFCQVCGAAGVSPAPPPAAAATMPCRQCGNALSLNARFCPACGAIVERCANCGTALLADALFCAECGAPTGARPAAEEPADDSFDASGYESLDWPEQNT